MTAFPIEPVLARADGELDASLARLFQLLRFKSVSTDPAFKGECRKAAEWLAAELAGMGFRAAVRPTPGQPMVVGHHDGPAGGGGPHLLYYGHYDVQPSDPDELWDSPPFEPTLVEAEHGRRIVARGAVDDKGQVMTILEAFRAWIAVHGTLPCRVTVLLEGEEESRSPSLDPFLAANRDELQADIAVICDTNMWNVETPAVSTMLRGIIGGEVTLHGPSRDLHSGMYGGAVVNPINALTRILGQIHDETGRVQFPGFYDGVMTVGANQLAEWRALGFDDAAFLGAVGQGPGIGEAGCSTLEKLWARPTCDLNGIWGGYTGAGGKTVIAARASAKFTCRLVAGQDPAKVAAGIRRFFAERTPPHARLELEVGDGSPAVHVASDSPWVQAAVRGLSRVFARKPALIGCGGSIPVVRSIADILGYDSLLVGYGLEDDRIHSPNEKFEVVCFHRGIKANAAILAELAGVKAG